MRDIHTSQRSNGQATILAIGTANPSNCVKQDTYPDYYFRVTDSEHMTELKKKFRVICEKSDIKQRYMHLTEEMLKQNPSWISHTQPSLRSRNAMAMEEVPRLGQEAAEKAIAEWGQPRSKITHLVFCTNTSFDMPGPDCRLRTLLGLDPSVERFFLCLPGCAGGVTSLRLAKDLAENKPGARVLVVCSEIYLMDFRGPSGDHLGNVVAQALFGDGAAAVVVGSDPVVGVERPLFQMAAAMQTLVPNSAKTVRIHLKEAGLFLDIGKEVPMQVSENIEKSLKEGFDPLGISDWNSVFWMAHPAGRAVLDKIEAKLSLKPEKLRASRKVLNEYGNMMSPTCLFVMDEMRKYSAVRGLRTTGEGLDWGVLCAFGPGLTIETIVLRSLPTHPN